MSDKLPPLSAAHFAELARELEPLVGGAWIREVESLPPRDVLLVLEPRSGSDQRIRRLRASADAEHARVHLQFGRVRRHKGPKAPFFQALEDAAVDAVLERLECLPNERILRFTLKKEEQRSFLLLEAIGRHANWILTDEADRILHVLVPPRPDSPAGERLAKGAVWELPRGGTAPDSPPLAATLPEPPAVREDLQALVELAPGSWRVEASHGEAAEHTLAEELRRDLKRRVRRRLKGARSKREGLEEQERETAKADRMQRDAELLLQEHGSKGRGNKELEVTDYYESEAPKRTISVDPKRTIRENAERLFSRAKKLRRASERLPADLEIARENEAALANLLQEADDTETDPLELEERALAGGLIARRPTPKEPKKKHAPAPRLSYRSFYGIRGSEIRVGRSARDNDELTFRASRGNDIWLHTSDSPGSHIVLRVEKGREPDPEELIDAAHLAVHFSPLSGARHADVHIARCKEVKKPKRAPAGLVTLSGGKTLHVRSEPKRLERLLASNRPGGPGDRTPPAKR